jgi:uncharacterized membrane protein
MNTLNEQENRPLEQLKTEEALKLEEAQRLQQEQGLPSLDAKLEQTRETYTKKLLAYESEKGKIYRIRQKLGLYTQKGLEGTLKERNDALKEAKAPYDQARKEMGQHLFDERKKALEAEGLTGTELEKALIEYKATEILARTITEERQKIIDAKSSVEEKRGLLGKLWKFYTGIQPKWKKRALGTILFLPATMAGGLGGAVMSTVGLGLGAGALGYGVGAGALFLIKFGLSDVAGFAGMKAGEGVDKWKKGVDEKVRLAQEEKYADLKKKFSEGSITQAEFEKEVQYTEEVEDKKRARDRMLLKLSVSILAGAASGAILTGGVHVGIKVANEDLLGNLHMSANTQEMMDLAKNAKKQLIDQQEHADSLMRQGVRADDIKLQKDLLDKETAVESTQSSTSVSPKVPHKQLSLEEFNKITPAPRPRTINIQAMEETGDMLPDGTIVEHTPDGAVPPMETEIDDDIVPLPPTTGRPIIAPHMDLNVPGTPAENHLFINPQSGIGYGNDNHFTTPVGMTPNEQMETLQRAQAVQAEAARELRIIGPNQEVTTGSMQDQLIRGVKPKNLVDTDPTHFRTTHDIERAWGKEAILDKPHGGIHGVKYETWSNIVDTHIRQNNIFFKSPAHYQEQKWLQNLFGDNPKKAWVMDNATGKKVSIDTMNWWTTKPNWQDIDRMPARYFMNFNKESINDLMKNNSIGMTDLKKMIDFGIVKNVGSASKPVFEFTSNHEFERLVKAFSKIDPQHGAPGVNETMAQYMHRMSTQMAETPDGTIFRMYDAKAPGAWHQGAPMVRGENTPYPAAYGRYVEQRTSGVMNQMSGRRGGFTDGTFFTNKPDVENILGRFAPGIPHDPSRVASQAASIFIQRAISGIGGGRYRTY